MEGSPAAASNRLDADRGGDYRRAKMVRLKESESDGRSRGVRNGSRRLMTTDLTSELAYAIVHEVADTSDTPLAEVDPPLGEVVNLEAVANLIETSEPPVRVTFTYREFEVTIVSSAEDVNVFVR